MTYPHIFLLCFLLITTFTFSSTSNTITIPLSPLFSDHPSSHPFQALKLAASSSISRVHHIKNHTKTPNSIQTPIHPKSYGGYSIDLNLGTPPQPFPFILDTASSLVWVPCSTHYECSKCDSQPKTAIFIPKNSSSAKLIACTNPKCAWVYGPQVRSRCRSCNPNFGNCTRLCPAYMVQYGTGSTAGFLFSENLNFPAKIVPDFLLGCSIVSVFQPAGIAGFGRGPESMPSQMNITRFSHCLVSHRFDDSPASGELVLRSGASGDGKTDGVSYTPFGINPRNKKTYYYVTVKRIVVGENRVRVPKGLLEVDGDNGNGGSIVDSGSTFTYMERPIYDSVTREFEKQVNFTRAKEVEKAWGLGLCYYVGEGTTSFPELSFHFRGGAKMRLPQRNYFSLVRDDVACLTIVSDDVAGVAGGPAVILGNYQMQDFYVEYDVENERFGFRSQSCKTSV